MEGRVEEALVRKMNFSSSLGGDLVNRSGRLLPVLLAPSAQTAVLCLPRETDRKALKQTEVAFHEPNCAPGTEPTLFHFILQQQEAGFKVVT